MSRRQIYYSDRYSDDQYEYRHVVLSREMVKDVPKSHLMSEDEWRQLGVQQSKSWIHYMIHKPEPHILLFRRPTKTLTQSYHFSLGSHTVSDGYPFAAVKTKYSLQFPSCFVDLKLATIASLSQKKKS